MEQKKYVNVDGYGLCKVLRSNYKGMKGWIVIQDKNGKEWISTRKLIYKK